MQVSTTESGQKSGGARANDKTRRTNSAAVKSKRTLHLKDKPTSEQPSQVSDVPGADAIGMIATAAYYLAEHRGFAPGRELEDWLTAEQQVRTLHRS